MVIFCLLRLSYHKTVRFLIRKWNILLITISNIVLKAIILKSTLHRAIRNKTYFF